MPTIDEALVLARAGWRLLPLRGKIPVTKHGVNDATADPQQVAKWWANGARHNIGARVPGHLVVLDCDPRNGGTLDALEVANGAPLPETLTVHSGRGDGGRHLYYRHPGGRPTRRYLPAGIDVKTDTGYCVLPPSLHPDTQRPYTWGDVLTPAPLPPALLALVRPPAPQPAAPMPPRRVSGGDPQTRLLRRAQHLAAHVAAAGRGQRNDRLHWAACQAHRNASEAGAPCPPEVFELLAQAALHAGLTEHETRATLASAHRTMGGAA